MLRTRVVINVMFGIALLTGCDAEDTDFRIGNVDYEVWLVDQSNTNGQTFGGAIHIYDGDELESSDADEAAPTDVIALGSAASALCLAKTGANPVRPHMMVFNGDDSHGILAFVASGHVVIFDAAS